MKLAFMNTPTNAAMPVPSYASRQHLKSAP
jgi:hypothetical protein